MHFQVYKAKCSALQSSSVPKYVFLEAGLKETGQGKGEKKGVAAIAVNGLPVTSSRSVNRLNGKSQRLNIQKVHQALSTQQSGTCPT